MSKPQRTTEFSPGAATGSCSGASSLLPPKSRSAQTTSPRRARRAGGFTLIELLITIMIIAIMAGMVLFAAYAAQDAAKEQHTKALIAKLDAIIKAKWDSYKTRRVPLNLQEEPFKDLNGDGIIDLSAMFVDLPGGTAGMEDPGEFFDFNQNGVHDTSGSGYVSSNSAFNSAIERAEYLDVNGNGSWDSFPPRLSAKRRLDCLRDLMRMELPDRWTDVTDAPITQVNPLGQPGTLIVRPAANQSYLRRYTTGTATAEYQGAECLYLIVQSCLAEQGDAKDIFRAADVGDVDKDGFPEFIDGWGQPIRFLRWAPGFQLSELQIVARATIVSSAAGTGTLTGTNLVQVDGSYVGGSIYQLLPTGSQLDTANFARITGYKVPAGGGTPAITYAGGSATSLTGQVVILAPDPSDPRLIYPVPPATPGPPSPQPQTMPFALYPLIYSPGPDKVYGILADSATPLSYAGVFFNPFHILTPGAPTANEFIGTARDLSTEPNFVVNGWLDNIHNHMITSK